MKVIAAYLLAVLGGNTTPSADDIKGILGSVGADCDDERIEFLLSEVKGKDITEGNVCVESFNSSLTYSDLEPPVDKAEMKVIAAYLLAVLGGNTTPSADDIKGILGSVGADCDDERIEFLLSEVKGKDITELIASGREKLASVPSGGGVAVAAAPAAGSAAPAAAESKKEEKVEEKEESDDDMGFSLFD